MRQGLQVVLLLALSIFCASAGAEGRVRVFAAASLTNALTDIAARWKSAGHAAPSLAFGGSALLSKQIEAGAPVDLFASADSSWMDYLDERRLIDRSSRTDLLGNTLVLVAPAGRGFHVEMDPAFDFAAAWRGKLCTGEPGVVPVGIYARQALESLRWWKSLEGRIVGTDDVRTALAFVERGECAVGIVYATDAAISSRVDVIARFPSGSHRPIVYPFALLRNANPQARAFLQYLRSPEAASAFAKHGFVLLQESR